MFKEDLMNIVQTVSITISTHIFRVVVTLLTIKSCMPPTLCNIYILNIIYLLPIVLVIPFNSTICTYHEN